MSWLYFYSLVPLLSVSLLLLFSVAGRSRTVGFGLPIFFVCVAVWSASLLMRSMAWSAPIASRFAACGAFVVAGYTHLAWDFARRDDYLLVWVAYTVASVITVIGLFFPGFLYDPVRLTQGPMFWPAMIVAMIAAIVPFAALWRQRLHTPHEERDGTILIIMSAGGVCYLGAWVNAILLANGIPLPFGLFAVLGSLILLARIVSSIQPLQDRQILENSLLYSSLTALIWAGFMFGVLSVVGSSAQVRAEYGLGALFLMSMAALAFEPLRMRLSRWFGGLLFPDRADARGLAEALVAEQTRNEHDKQLAELGVFVSAIAHEVRNPLGVMKAQIKLLERRGADPKLLDQLGQQLDRASGFVDELVDYGRPKPIEPRGVDAAALLELAISSATQARAELCDHVEVHLDAVAPLAVQVDQALLTQALIILVDNALLATRDAPDAAIWVSASIVDSRALRVLVEDNGPGIPKELVDNLFEPFVTGRKRDDDAKGTGLGLAIASRICERHQGSLQVDSSSTYGGARFILEIPTKHALLSAPTRD